MPLPYYIVSSLLYFAEKMVFKFFDFNEAEDIAGKTLRKEEEKKEEEE